MSNLRAKFAAMNLHQTWYNDTPRETSPPSLHPQNKMIKWFVFSIFFWGVSIHLTFGLPHGPKSTSASWFEGRRTRTTWGLMRYDETWESRPMKLAKRIKDDKKWEKYIHFDHARSILLSCLIFKASQYSLFFLASMNWNHPASPCTNCNDLICSEWWA